MALDENGGEDITLAQAQELIRAYRTRFPDETRALFAGSNNISRILDQPGCIGIRIYNGYDADARTISFVIVGVDQDEKDMTSGIILDRLNPCPQFCDFTSPLMV